MEDTLPLVYVETRVAKFATRLMPERFTVPNSSMDHSRECRRSEQNLVCREEEGII